MPDIHDGFASSHHPPFQRESSESSGSFVSAAGGLSSLEAEPRPDTAILFHAIRDFQRQTPLTVPRNEPSSPLSITQGVERWRRLGSSVWRASHRFLDGPPPRDVPRWLDSRPTLAGGSTEALSFDEEALPLRYGIQLEQRPDHSSPGTGSKGVPPCPLGGMLPPSPLPSLLHFPHALLSALPRSRTPMIHFADGVLPFRSPARQTITIFSLIGGTGRTSIAAGLARMLAGHGLRVLLADTSAFSLLPRLFGASETRQGLVRSFSPASGEKNRMISLLSLAVDAFAGDETEQYRILHEFSVESARMDRIIWDLSGAPLDWAAKVLNLSPQILIPLLPNAHSLVQLRATERFINRCHDDDPSPHLHYVLNDFDEQDPLHVDMRGRFRQLLGSQLLPIALRRSPLVDEALSRGRTVVDHAPASPAVTDLWRLAQQLHQVDERAALPAVTPSTEWVEH